MNHFVIAAGLIAMAHLWAVWRKPRAAIIVSGVLWLLYAIYERQMVNGVLCAADCNIRVDLVFFIPILGLATYCAWRTYNGRSGQIIVIGAVLGILAMLVLALVLEDKGYGALSALALLGALAIGVLASRSRLRTRRL